MEREDGEHAAVIVGGRGDLELGEGALHVLLHGVLGDEESLADRAVRASRRL